MHYTTIMCEHDQHYLQRLSGKRATYKQYNLKRTCSILLHSMTDTRIHIETELKSVGNK